MKHTPGPWKAELQVLSDGYDENGVMINPRTIKDYFSIKAGEGFWREKDNSLGFCATTYMSEANARLLAAAPDLLNNLERIIDRIEESKMDNMFPSAYDRAKEAIKKAKGL